jgi:perosamine synthetase
MIEVVEFIKSLYVGENFIPLHRPVMGKCEKRYLSECIESNFVSSVGEKVVEFERRIAKVAGAGYGVAAVNGTSALHIALLVAGVKPGTEVLTQALTFVATCNSIAYCSAEPVFLDVDRETMGLSPGALSMFLQNETKVMNGNVVNRRTGNRITACVPMHTFGMPCRIEEISDICDDYRIPLVEDAAESLGSYRGNKHTGGFGLTGIFSFNGNKIITTGGGGVIVTDDTEIAQRAKHLTMTAKQPHPYEFYHTELAYNYRLPNLNAALGCAQLDQLDNFLKIKRSVANKYNEFFSEYPDIDFISEPEGSRSNYWINAIVLKDLAQRNRFLKYMNEHGVMVRPVWELIVTLPMYRSCYHDGLQTSKWLADRVVNIPSSVPYNMYKG